MPQDKVPTKLEMYQAFRDNLVIGDNEPKPTLQLPVKLKDLKNIPVLDLKPKLSQALLATNNFKGVVRFEVWLDDEGYREGLAVIYKRHAGAIEARVAILNQNSVNGVIEFVVGENDRLEVCWPTDPFRLPQIVLGNFNATVLVKTMERDDYAYLFLHRFVLQRVSETLSTYESMLYGDMLIGEATAYMWHEYLTWVPPDTPTESV